MATYLRTPGLDGNCHDCNPDDPCWPGNFLYIPCANQCGVPGENDPQVVLPYDAPEYAMVKVNGVRAVYYRGSATDDDLYGDLQEDTVTSCPTTQNYCFTACCTSGASPARIIISYAQFVALFPGITPPTSSGSPASLCIKWEYCYYCSCIPCINPVSDEASTATAAEAGFNDCAWWDYIHFPGKMTEAGQELCEHCIGCNSCEPALSWRYTVTIAGCGGSFAVYNGTWSLRWYGGCTWRIQDGILSSVELLELYWTGTAWQVRIITYDPINSGTYFKIWEGGAGRCDPAGTFAESSCNCDPYYGCTSGSCESSAGATCVVS